MYTKNDSTMAMTITQRLRIVWNRLFFFI